MNGRSAGPAPPYSPESEWSGYSNYQNAGPPQTSPGFPPPSRGSSMMTPPMSGSSSNGNQPRMSTGMPGRPSGPSPPNSVGARSSYGTTMSSNEARRRQTMHMEDRLSQHYVILRRYLGQSLRDQNGDLKPNRARDKLTKLSPVQFQELSTDVYDELLRRQSAHGQQTNGPGQVPAYLLPRDGFHPKRNQARQKLATLPPVRFRDLATDVFYELERRFPHFAGRDIPRNGSPLGPPSRVGTPNGMRYGPRNQSLSVGPPGGPEDPYGRPTAKQFQSNTIIPNKSTMVEDDDEDGLSDVYANKRDTTLTARSGGGSEKDRKANAEIEAQLGGLQTKVKELEDTLRDKNAELDSIKDKSNDALRDKENFAELQAELETKLHSAQGLNQSLQAEIEKVRREQASSERDLRSQIQAMTSEAQGGSEWKTRYETLDKKHREMESGFVEHEGLVRDVRKETAGYLDQLKALSMRTAEASDREDRLLGQLQRLEGEVQDWKSRYAGAASQSSAAQASWSKPLPSVDSSSLTQSNAFMSAQGLIKMIHITQFQLAIDDLLHSARSEQPQAVLAKVKAVAVTIRDITLDVSKAQLKSPETSEKVAQMKAKISATTNNLITASKNFAVSQGLSPVSLLDAAASHVTASMIELAKIIKVSGAAPIEGDDDGYNTDIIDSPADYYGIGNNRASAAGSTYSVDSKPRLTSRAFSGSQQRKPLPNGVSNGVPAKQAQQSAAYDGRLEELKTFLDARTDTLRATLQDIVASIRASAPPADILDGIASITSTTSQIMHQAAPFVPDNSRPHDTLGVLSRLIEKMEDKGREGEQINTEAAWKEYVNAIPPIGFEIARAVKDLGAWVEEEVRNGDFS